MNINELLKAKKDAKAKAETLLNAAISAKRDMTAEENTQYDALVAEVAKYDNLIAKASTVSGWEAGLDKTNGQALRPVATNNPSKAEIFASAEYKSAVDTYARLGLNGVTPDILAVLNEGTGSAGGYAVPQEFATQLVEKKQNINVMRQLANVITTASDRNIPVENSLGSAAWTAESGAYNESDASFNKVVLSAHKLTRIIKVSEELLQDASFDLQAYLVRNFGRVFGIAEEAAFVNGSGVGQPTGVLAGATVGITTAVNSAIAADEVIELYHSLKPAYRANAAWVMNDATALAIRKLKDAQNRYLWTDGFNQAPNTILGRPVYVSDGMPTIASTAKVIAFGDFSYYTIADRTPSTFQRLNELYAANGQVGFKMAERTDGALTVPEAVQVLQMAV